ncbi:MAG: protein translocase subunit SecF [Candidatus Absconditabacteria bacterium]
MFNIIKNSKKWVTLSIGLLVLSVVLFLFNLSFSIQFTGGLEIVVPKVTDTKSLENDLNTFLLDNNYKDTRLYIGEKDGNTNILFQPKSSDDEFVMTLSELAVEHLEESEVIKSVDDVMETTIIGASIGNYMKQSAMRSLAIGLLFMAIYILFAFSGMRKIVPPLTLAGVVIFTTLFDIGLPAGAYGLLMYFNPSVQIDSVFIIALLTIMGYSINDTIIIFDRLRENINLHEGSLNTGKMRYSEVFESSLWQSMRRSIGTSLSTLLVVVAMFIFGTGILKTFAFTLGVGVAAGTFSSIFLATPLIYLLSQNYKKENKSK